MKSQGLGQGRHCRGPAIIQDIDLQGIIGNPPDSRERGPDDCQGFAAARHEDVHGDTGLELRVFRQGLPEPPDTVG